MPKKSNNLIEPVLTLTIPYRIETMIIKGLNSQMDRNPEKITHKKRKKQTQITYNMQLLDKNQY